MLARAVAIGILALTFAAPAHAGSKVLVTPSLQTPGGGSITCSVVNASEKSELSVWIALLPGAGGPILPSPAFATIAPLRSASHSSGVVAEGYCVVHFESGSPKNARVTLSVQDAGGVTASAVSAPRK